VTAAGGRTPPLSFSLSWQPPLSPILSPIQKKKKTTTQGLLRATRTVLSSPLPRIFTKGAGGGPPTAVEGGPIGGDFAPEALGAAAADAAHKLADNVLAPMERWRIGFATVARQMARLEAMRLELDSRRHTSAALAADVERRRGGGGAGPTGAAGSDGTTTGGPAPSSSSAGRAAARLDDLTKRLRHKEGKETAALNRFLAEEELVAQHLAQLIGDAEWLKSFVADVMRAEADAFGAALGALGPTKPTPDVRTPRYEEAAAAAAAAQAAAGNGGGGSGSGSGGEEGRGGGGGGRRRASPPPS
jgi:hypothetical protein